MQEEFVYPERQVLSKENYAKFLKAQERGRNLINHIEEEINDAKRQKKFYEDAIKKLEKQKSSEAAKKLKDYQTNIKILDKTIEIEMMLQARVIKKYTMLEKTVVCEGQGN